MCSMSHHRNVISVADAAERAGLSKQAIHDLIDQGASGPFPGAFKATPSPNSPYLIPLGEFNIWQKKRAQAQKA